MIFSQVPSSQAIKNKSNVDVFEGTNINPGKRKALMPHYQSMCYFSSILQQSSYL